jgi:hypothetical protein
LGVVGWLLVVVLWVLFPPVVAVAAGQFIIVAIAPTEAHLVATLPGAVAVSGLLLADVPVSPPPMIDELIFVGLVISLVTGLLLLGQAVGLFAAAAVLMTLVGFTSYVCHRYLLLQFGLVVDEPETDQASRSEAHKAE